MPEPGSFSKTPRSFFSIFLGMVSFSSNRRLPNPVRNRHLSSFNKISLSGPRACFQLTYLFILCSLVVPGGGLEPTFSESHHYLVDNRATYLSYFAMLRRLSVQHLPKKALASVVALVYSYQTSEIAEFVYMQYFAVLSLL